MCPLRGALEEPRVEWKREQFSQTVRTGLTPKIGQQHLEVAAEFPQDLAARAARRRRRLGIGHNRDAAEPAVSLGERLEHGDALGAHRQPVSGVLDVATCDDSPVVRFERSANFETGKSSMRMAAGTSRRVD